MRARRADEETTRRYDVGIVGGGPAGLSAAILSARYLHTVVLVDSGDPRNWRSRGITGYLGLSGVRPAELRRAGRQSCRDLGVDLRDEIVLCAERLSDEVVSLSLHGGTQLTVRRLLLAIGLRDVLPEIPGLARIFGVNAHVCPDCDGYEARGKKIVVIGHGRRALRMALDLTTWTRDIIICTNGTAPRLDLPEDVRRLDALHIPVLTERIARVVVDGLRIESLRFEGGMELDADKIFFTIAQYPADDLGAQLGCTRDREGHVLIDPHHHTSIKNVFAAGDVTPRPQLAIVAAAGGAVAALAIHRSLVPPERRLARRR
jgi:thioredoxin reductase